MKELSKDRIIGIAGTLLFHALLFLLLWFLVMEKPPQQPEAGISVVMGEEFAMTEVEVVPQSSQTPSAVRPDAVKTENPLIAQNSEVSIPADTAQSPVKDENPADKANDEARRAEEIKDRADNLMAGAFGKGNSMGSIGNEGDVKSVQGSAEGNAATGASEGTGYGTYSLGDRSLAGDGSLPRPAYDVQDEGRVVVTITVNPEGKVVKASINSRTGTSNPALRNAALKAAKLAVFNKINGVNNQEGTITYYFKLVK